MSKDEEKNGSGPAESELISGRHAVVEALRQSKPLRVLLADNLRGAMVNEITLLARQRRVPVERLTPRRFVERLGQAAASAQGVAALVPPYHYLSLSRLLTLAREDEKPPFLIILDHIEDPQNLGAIMRTADAAGVHGIVVPGERAVGVTAAVRRVAAGAAERLPVAMVGNLNRAAEQLKKEGFWIYGAEADGGKPFYRADYRRPLALVLGSEGRGLSRLVRRNCDVVVSLPMPGGGGGSLNVSATAAVLIYAVIGQREGW